MHPQSNLRISYDILTIVINQLGSEQRYNELNACSQTCQMLLHPCRLHLFATVSVRENAPQFVALLKGNSTIPKYIQELTYRPYVTSEDLAHAFLLLNNIKVLNYYGQGDWRDWKLLPLYMQYALAYLFSSPSTSCIYVHNVHNLPASLLSSCSALKHLTIGECLLCPPEACDNVLGAPPQLLSLDLSKDYLSDPGTLMEGLPKMRQPSGLPILDLSSLRSLTVFVYDSRQEQYFENILRLTPNLDYLQCSVFQGMTPDSWTLKLGIVLPTLRSLRLTWDAYGTPTELAFLGLIKILEALAYQRNCINELFLILLRTNRSHASNEVLLDLDWGLLDQVLADRSGFPQLEKLTIQLWSRSRYEWQKVTAGIQTRFAETKTSKFSRLSLADYLDFKFEVHDWR